MLKPVIMCILYLSLGCLWGCRPKEATATGDVPGVQMLADGDKFKPFVRQGRLLFDKEKTETDRSADSGKTVRFELGRLIYDDRGQLVAQTPPADSSEHLFPSFGQYYYKERLRLTFSGRIDPADRLVYLCRFSADHGLLLYDFAGNEPPRAVEIFSLPDLRREAESGSIFWVEESLRDRLRREGFQVPDKRKRPNRNTIERTRFEKMFADYLNESQRSWEEAIRQFVATDREEAYTLTTLSDPYYYLGGGQERRRDYVVLPGRGFAFEMTEGMTFPELPAAAGADLPQWDEKRGEVSIRRTGSRLHWQFHPIAFVPWWETWREYFYTLTLDGVEYHVADTDRLRVLDAVRADGKLYFSLIDENGLAELFVYGGAENTEKE